MTCVQKRKGDKACQATPCEAAQRQNLRAEVYDSPKLSSKFFAVGNTDLLSEPLLGLISSRECPGAYSGEQAFEVLSHPDIAHVFYLRGLMERIGRGGQLIINACRDHGLPAPKWVDRPTGVNRTSPLVRSDLRCRPK